MLDICFVTWMGLDWVLYTQMGREILQQSIYEKLNTVSRRPLHNGFLVHI
jgi:hypothetical protein